MKYFLLLISFSLAVSVHSQTIEVSEGNEKLGGSFRSVLSVMIREADEELILKSWKKIMKAHKAKLKNSDEEVFADNAVLEDLSTNTIDVYARVQKENESIRFSVAFDLGGAYLSASQNSGGFRAAKKMIRDFAVDVTKDAIDAQMKLAERDAKNLSWKKSSLEKENAALHRDIELYKGKIETAEKSIQENLKEQENTQKLIEAKRKDIEEIKEKSIKVK